MYNFAFAFVICAVVYIIGEVFSALTKAWIPSVFITAVLFLLGYWTIIPHDVVSDAYLSFGGTLAFISALFMWALCLVSSNCWHSGKLSWFASPVLPACVFSATLFVLFSWIRF